MNPSTDTGYTTVNINHASRIRGGNTAAQTFQLLNAGTVDKIHLAYSEFGWGQPDGLVDFTFRLDANNDGSYEVNQSFVGFSVSGFSTAASPVHWIEFALSAENITLSAATTHSFRVTNDEPYDVGRAIWTQWHENADVYANGVSLGNGLDEIFAVTTTPVPEPRTALFGIACVGVSAFRRRRRA